MPVVHYSTIRKPYMTKPSLVSRRQALKMLSTIPMLPMTSAFSTLAHAKSNASFVSAEFVSMPAPSLMDPVQMADTAIGSALNITLSDKTTISYKLAYQPFFMTGDMVPDGKGGKILAGGYVDIHNKPIMDKSVPGKERQFFSDCPDGASLLSLPKARVPGVKGKAVFAVVQFEYTTRDLAQEDMYGKLPSPIAVLTLDQDPATGKLSLVKYHNVDMSKAHGLWITCGASLSPWNTHLSSEEYEPDAQFIQDSKVFKGYSKNLYGDENKANPYHYGHLPEITVHPDGTGTVRKHYCLGRISHELIQVMPDNRTVLMGDDYTNGGLFMFIADREKDLSAGTLYVAKLAAGLSLDTNASPVSMQWVKLGHATSAEIEAMADKLKPSDIISVTKTDPNDASYTKIFVEGVANWVKLKPGMEKAAAFLETHRYANLVGGTMVFTKMEGTTVNAKDKVAYSALANIQDSMIKGGKGWREELGVSLPKTLKAGGILSHKLTGGQTDISGQAMDSEWVPVATQFMLIGEDIKSDELGNTANPDKIASPDNLKFSEKMRTLFIGEDSGNHVNNFLWAYNVDTKKLSRILSTPAGAESTGLHAVDAINGWTYIMSNFQHPGDWTKLHDKVKGTLDPIIRAKYNNRFGAMVGYITAESTAIRLQGK